MSGVYGLVVAGGLSSRMKTDKSLLNYHGQPQRYYLYDISCNAAQAGGIPSSYNVIIDDKQYAGIGPMAAILSAFERYPEQSFIAIGCDYPDVSAMHLQQLKQGLDKGQTVSLFNTDSGFYEPLLAGYHYSLLPDLVAAFQDGNYSLQQVLKQVNARKITCNALSMPQSIDTPEAYAAYIRQYKKD
jgi:molybdenum cofactor guanylyltransferase